MQELIALCLGVLVGCFIGFNVGVNRIVDEAEITAQTFIDALRDRFGSTFYRGVNVGEDEFGDQVVEIVGFVELPEDLEDLGSKLFNLGNRRG